MTPASQSHPVRHDPQAAQVLDLPYISPTCPLHLPDISHISSTYLPHISPYISPISPQVLDGLFLFISQVMFVSMDCISIKAPRVRVLLGVNIMLALVDGVLSRAQVRGSSP